jgi:hypothetical protein
MVFARGKRLGFEFKCSDAPGVTPSMHVALNDLALDRLHVVYPGRVSYPLHERMEVVAIEDLPTRLARYRPR